LTIEQAPTKVLVLGATGMLGNIMVRYLGADPRLAVTATARARDVRTLFPADYGDRLVGGVEVEDADGLEHVFARHQPDVAINCVGLVKQLDAANDVLATVPVNTLLPHRLAKICKQAGARLVHFSTDCVFSGDRGDYRESDLPDARDLYGLSKLLGETADAHTITLRTSMVGRELRSRHGLLEWLLSQRGSVKGYRKAIFSGLTTVELARIVQQHIIPRPDLHGLYHVSGEPISKLALLELFRAEYKPDIEIVADDALVIDRSLNSELFRAATGYIPPSWPEMVAGMRRFETTGPGR
jgi:dTDP-4-dehydrorhamnose reductase